MTVRAAAFDFEAEPVAVCTKCGLSCAFEAGTGDQSGQCWREDCRRATVSAPPLRDTLAAVIAADEDFEQSPVDGDDGQAINGRCQLNSRYFRAF